MQFRQIYIYFIMYWNTLRVVLSHLLLLVSMIVHTCVPLYTNRTSVHEGLRVRVYVHTPKAHVPVCCVLCADCTHTRQKYPVWHCICQSHTKTTQLCIGVHSKKELPQFSNVVFAAPQCSMQASMSPGHGYPPSSPLISP